MPSSQVLSKSHFFFSVIKPELLGTGHICPPQKPSSQNIGKYNGLLKEAKECVAYWRIRGRS